MQTNDHPITALTLTEQLRCGFSANISADLIAFIDSMSATMHQLPAETILAANQMIEKLFQQYEKHDWLGVADTIEYELNVLLHNT